MAVIQWVNLEKYEFFVKDSQADGADSKVDHIDRCGLLSPVISFDKK